MGYVKSTTFRLTKSLTRSQFHYLKTKLVVIELPSRSRRDIKEKTKDR